jgi:hypothetical protein
MKAQAAIRLYHWSNITSFMLHQKEGSARRLNVWTGDAPKPGWDKTPRCPEFSVKPFIIWLQLPNDGPEAR